MVPHFSKEDLLRVYHSLILPIQDYCSCVYNSSNQVSALERLQAQALETIYGYEYSNRARLEMTDLKTLKAMRDEKIREARPEMP